MLSLVNRITKEKPGWCSDPHLPPCAAYELLIMCTFPYCNKSFSFLFIEFTRLILTLPQQICWNHGSRLLSRCMALRLAYDSGPFLFLIFIYITFSAPWHIYLFEVRLKLVEWLGTRMGSGFRSPKMCWGQHHPPFFRNSTFSCSSSVFDCFLSCSLLMKESGSLMLSGSFIKQYHHWETRYGIKSEDNLIAMI